jgi:mechanosensitive ion channel-like protein
MNDALTDALRTTFSVIADFVPKLLLFLVILLIGYLVAKVFRRVVSSVLKRVGFDRVVERGGVKRVLERGRLDASDILAKIVYYAVFLFALQLAFNAFGANPVSDLLVRIVAFLPQIFVAILIIAVVAAIASALRSLITDSIGGTSYGPLVAKIAAGFVLALGIIAALNQVGIATTVTTPVLIAILATVAGILVVGAGGGLIRPMQRRWEMWLHSAEDEARQLQDHRQTTPADKTLAPQAGLPVPHQDS